MNLCIGRLSSLLTYDCRKPKEKKCHLRCDATTATAWSLQYAGTSEHHLKSSIKAYIYSKQV